MLRQIAQIPGMGWLQSSQSRPLLSSASPVEVPISVKDFDRDSSWQPPQIYNPQDATSFATSIHLALAARRHADPDSYLAMMTTIEVSYPQLISVQLGHFSQSESDRVDLVMAQRRQIAFSLIENPPDLATQEGRYSLLSYNRVLLQILQDESLRDESVNQKMDAALKGIIKSLTEALQNEDFSQAQAQMDLINVYRSYMTPEQSYRVCARLVLVNKKLSQILEDMKLKAKASPAPHRSESLDAQDIEAEIRASQTHVEQWLNLRRGEAVLENLKLDTFNWIQAANQDELMTYVSGQTMVQGALEAQEILSFIEANIHELPANLLMDVLTRLARYLTHSKPVVRRRCQPLLDRYFDKLNTTDKFLFLTEIKTLRDQMDPQLDSNLIIIDELNTYYKQLNAKIQGVNVLEVYQTLFEEMKAKEAPEKWNKVYKVLLSQSDKFKSPEDFITTGLALCEDASGENLKQLILTVANNRTLFSASAKLIREQLTASYPELTEPWSDEFWGKGILYALKAIYCQRVLQPALEKIIDSEALSKRVSAPSIADTAVWTLKDQFNRSPEFTNLAVILEQLATLSIESSHIQVGLTPSRQLLESWFFLGSLQAVKQVREIAYHPNEYTLVDYRDFEALTKEQQKVVFETLKALVEVFTNKESGTDILKTYVRESLQDKTPEEVKLFFDTLVAWGAFGDYGLGFHNETVKLLDWLDQVFGEFVDLTRRNLSLFIMDRLKFIKSQYFYQLAIQHIQKILDFDTEFLTELSSAKLVQLESELKIYIKNISSDFSSSAIPDLLRKANDEDNEDNKAIRVFLIYFFGLVDPWVARHRGDESRNVENFEELYHAQNFVFVLLLSLYQKKARWYHSDQDSWFTGAGLFTPEQKKILNEIQARRS